jgi:hypothetical protein
MSNDEINASVFLAECGVNWDVERVDRVVCDKKGNHIANRFTMAFTRGGKRHEVVMEVIFNGCPILKNRRPTVYDAMGFINNLEVKSRKCVCGKCDSVDGIDCGFASCMALFYDACNFWTKEELIEIFERYCIFRSR